MVLDHHDYGVANKKTRGHALLRFYSSRPPYMIPVPFLGKTANVRLDSL